MTELYTAGPLDVWTDGRRMGKHNPHQDLLQKRLSAQDPALVPGRRQLPRFRLFRFLS